jgi:flavodoxin
VLSIFIVYASTSGHTEYVVNVLSDALKQKKIHVEIERAEKVQAEDMKKGDVLILASSTWNTGNIEGQLNPHMHALLLDRAKDNSLKGKGMGLIALGDERYRYIAHAAVFLEEYAARHQGRPLLPTLKILNEPYGQEDKVKEWARQLVEVMQSVHSVSEKKRV